MRLASAIAYDMKLQFRHGFYYAYVLISAFYVLVLHMVPADYREQVDILLTFTDPSMLGCFFVGGLVLLEKGQGIHDSLFVTPFRPQEYILSKTFSLLILSISTSYVIHISVFGFSTKPLLFMISVALTSIFYTMIGIGVAVRCQSVNGFFLMSMGATLVFMLPILEPIGLWSSPFFYVLPSKASLLLLSSAFEQLELKKIIYALIMLPAWGMLAYQWTCHSIQRFIVMKIGSGGS